MAREIVLDTETTGFRHEDGHRLIEVGCIEIEDLLPTGRTFHALIDPERLIDPDAVRVHGITDDHVRGKPRFHEMCEALLEFVGGDVIVAHNASFDRGFLNFELTRCGRALLHEHRWVDTLRLAQQRFPGMHNSLDALCKRYRISLAERTLHGALIDARLLASVYLELKGGKERALDLSPAGRTPALADAAGGGYGARPRPLPGRATAEELARHASWVRATLKDGAVWSTTGLLDA